MKKLIPALSMIVALWSCDYSTSSNGNIDAAFAREEKKPNSGDEQHHGSVDMTEHKDDNASDHVEKHATMGEDDKVVPTDTSIKVQEQEDHHVGTGENNSSHERVERAEKKH